MIVAGLLLVTNYCIFFVAQNKIIIHVSIGAKMALTNCLASPEKVGMLAIN